MKNTTLTQLDRKTQILGNNYKQVVMAEHETIGTIKTTQAGMEIHLKSGLQTIIDGGLSLTLKAGGQHIVLNPAGIWMALPVRIGGVPIEGTPSIPLPPLAKYQGVNSTASPPVILQSMVGKNMPTPQAAGFKYNLRYHLKDDVTGEFYANSPYIAVLPNDKTFKGITDPEGYTDLFDTNDPQNIVVQLLDKKERIEPIGAPVVLEPTQNTQHNLKYLLTDDQDQPCANHNYLVMLPNEQLIKGITDSQGYTQPFYSRYPEDIIIHLLKDQENITI